MPSDSKKRDAQRKKDARNKKITSISSTKKTNGVTNGNADPNREMTEEEKLCAKLEEEARISAEARACTGSLASHARSRDIKIANFSITFFGCELLQDTMLELNCGRRYGVIGLNGCGKSSLLAVLGNREVPIPEHMDIFYLSREIPASSKTALQCVMEVDEERIKLEKLAEELAMSEDDSDQEQLIDIYERLDDMSADLAEVKAARILHGLGFDKNMQQKQAKDFSGEKKNILSIKNIFTERERETSVIVSREMITIIFLLSVPTGGWRMRIALARALFVKPHLLLLDEPTNHLDLDACVWLEEELKEYKRILVIISHSQDFLNGVCTNIIHMTQKRLKYYTGNYEAFVRTRMELLENQMKQYNWEQDQIAHMKNYIARFGHGSAKLARQAQSKEKTLAKMVAQGLTEKVTDDKVLNFYFPACGKVPPPVIMVQNVSFRYNETTPWIYKNLEFGIDLDTRLALVGPNGK